MRKAWFCYEMGSKGPSPVIHYDNDPVNTKGTSQYLKPKVIQSHELDDRFERNDNEIAMGFNYLTMLFPYVGNHFNIEG